MVDTHQDWLEDIFVEMAIRDMNHHSRRGNPNLTRPWAAKCFVRSVNATLVSPGLHVSS